MIIDDIFIPTEDISCWFIRNVVVESDINFSEFLKQILHINYPNISFVY